MDKLIKRKEALAALEEDIADFMSDSHEFNPIMPVWHLWLAGSIGGSITTVICFLILRGFK